ncbi:MAG: hypothetical protein ACRDRV_21695 [Pseudonocardiaceae bacterium]
MPLLPEVAAGILEPRRVTVPLRAALPHTRVILGNAAGVDLTQRTCTVVDVERRPRVMTWDRLVLACGAGRPRSASSVFAIVIRVPCRR